MNSWFFDKLIFNFYIPTIVHRDDESLDEIFSQLLSLRINKNDSSQSKIFILKITQFKNKIYF